MSDNDNERSDGSSERDENKEGPEETLRVSRSIDDSGSCLKIRWLAGGSDEDTPIRVPFQRKIRIFYARTKPPQPLPPCRWDWDCRFAAE